MEGPSARLAQGIQPRRSNTIPSAIPAGDTRQKILVGINREKRVVNPDVGSSHIILRETVYLRRCVGKSVGGHPEIIRFGMSDIA